jgi:hypothetical protein
MRTLLLLLLALSISTNTHSEPAPAPKQTFFDGIGLATYTRQEFEKRKVRVIAHSWEHQGPIGTLQVVYLRSNLRLPYRHGDTIADVLSTSKGTLESSSHFQMDLETGLDVIVSLPDDKILRTRVVADGLREMRLKYIGSRNNPRAADVEQFFNNIRFLD